MTLKMETIRINVGGTIFETARDTLTSLSDWKLADLQVLQSYYRHKEKDYFFDRDPIIFGAILNYLRTSNLHLPTTVCGPWAKEELDFWKIDTQVIQHCCWTSYNKWNTSLEALAKLEHDRKTFLPGGCYEDFDNDSNTWWERNRPKVWHFLNRSNSSLGAKILGIVSFIFVVLSITTMILSTTKYFQVENEIHSNSTLATGTSNLSTTAKPSSTNKSNTNWPTATESSNPEQLTDASFKDPTLNVIDIICFVYFCFEYILRLVFSPQKSRFLIAFLSVVDILALLPDFIEIVVFNIKPELRDDLHAIDFVFILRVLRVLRIFRLVRHSAGLWVLIYTLRASIRELMLLVWFLGMGIIFFASLIYIAEDESDFPSIPDGFWWAIITMTTVGYGDVYPKTPWGKLIGSFCAMTGVLVIGFSVPALVSNFMLYYSQMEFSLMMEKTKKAKRTKTGKHLKKDKMNNNELNRFTVSTQL